MSGAAVHNAGKPGADARIFRVLDQLLRITRWVSVFILVTIPLMIGGAPFLPITFGSDPADLDAVWPTFYIGLVYDREEMTFAAFVVQALADFIYAALSIFVLTQLIRILDNVRAGRAFVRDNGARLRRIGYASLYSLLGAYAVLFIGQGIDLAGIADTEGLRIQLSPDPWIAVLASFALSTIFLEGAALKEEQELTV